MDLVRAKLMGAPQKKLRLILLCSLALSLKFLYGEGGNVGSCKRTNGVTKHGRRLNTTIIAKFHATDWFQCVFRCIDEKCCRSMNYKNGVAHGIDNCEFLHVIASEESPQNLLHNEMYVHVSLVDKKELDCSCLSLCEINGTCKPCKCDEGFIANGTSCTAKSCKQLYEQGRQTISGVYEINPDGKGGFDVFCSRGLDGRGWTMIQLRFDGNTNFNRTWTEYKEGFGDMTGEFWLGLEKIRRITTARDHDVKIVTLGWTNNHFQHREVKYEKFKLEGHDKNYMLSVGRILNCTGPCFDVLGPSKNKPFFTNDKDSKKGCAAVYGGGWWYGDDECSKYKNLNSKYFKYKGVLLENIGGKDNATFTGIVVLIR